MKMMLKGVFAGVCLLFLSSCGFIPHDVTVAPDLPVQQQNIGKNQSLLVNVLDRRPKELIGYRTYMKTGNISLDEKQQLAAVVRASVENGFSKLGFNIVSDGQPDRTVEIDIRLVDYEGLWGFFTVGAMARASFEVECRLPSGRVFNNLYRVEYEHRSLFLPAASTNEKWINEAISDALMRMFDDQSFMGFLSSDN